MPFPAPTIIESVQILCIVRQLAILCSSRNYEFHFSGKSLTVRRLKLWIS